MITDRLLFVRRLTEEMRRLQRLPKVQVERLVGPILGLFLPAAIAPCLGPLGATDGFELVAPEFPLKRSDSNQSTNIDWLLVNRDLGLVVLLELKTDRGSVSNEQLSAYSEVCERIERSTAAFLIDDLRAIRAATARDTKYDALIKLCEPFEPAFRAARRAATVFLVPDGTRLPAVGVASRLDVHFRDLPAKIDSDLADEWVVFRDGLIDLEAPAVAPAARTTAPLSVPELAEHILANLRRHGEKRVPLRFWVGSTGGGARPNYQVEFRDGTVRAYYNGGALHPRDQFDTGNLVGPHDLGRGQGRAPS